MILENRALGALLDYPASLDKSLVNQQLFIPFFSLSFHISK